MQLPGLAGRFRSGDLPPIQEFRRMPTPRRKVPPRRPAPVRPAFARIEAENQRPSLVHIDLRANEDRADLVAGTRVPVTSGRFVGEIVEVLGVRRTPVGMVVVRVRDASGVERTARASDLGRTA
jgi:hypothetical protein